VRVGVVDSGVHPGHPHIGGIAGGVSIATNGDVVEGEQAILDRIGHGTAVTAAIQEKAPDADYFAVRVFHATLRTSAATLVRAIDWCIEHRMDVVNLSLGAVSQDHRPAFVRAAARAEAAGLILVAAREANGEPCYPGCLPNVLGVALDRECGRGGYRAEGRGSETVFHASGYPRPVPGVPPAGNLYGISFAVANMSGFVARACSDQPAVQGACRLQSIKVALAGAAAGNGRNARNRILRGREWNKPFAGM
jgi:subtilisin family serine protease